MNAPYEKMRSIADAATRLALTAFALLASASDALAEDGKPLVIEARVTSIHDRLPPYEVRNVVVEETYRFRLMGGANVEEEWSNRPVSTEYGAVNLGGFSGTQSSALGGAGRRVNWKVLGPHRLRRISEGQRFIEVLDFEIREPHECVLKAKFLLEKGKTAMIARRRDNGQLAEFSINKVTSATCTIQ